MSDQLRTDTAGSGGTRTADALLSIQGLSASYGAVRALDNVSMDIPERGGWIVELTVEENLRLGALWRSDRRDRTTFDEVMDLFPPLVERRNKTASTLSGGERQMLAIGRALMGRPRVLLLDEPSLGLAPLVTKQIFTLLRDLRERTGLTVVLVEQNAAGALSVTDHGYVLNQGSVAAEGPSGGLLADDRTRHAYLGF